MKEIFIEKKIYYHDTDSGGVVYYAKYLEHLEEGRSEYCLGAGINLADYAKKGVIFPVVHVEIDYKSPARYGDVIKVITTFDKIGKCSVYFLQEIRKEEHAILQSKTVWACVDKYMKPTPIPEEIRSRLLKFKETL